LLLLFCLSGTGELSPNTAKQPAGARRAPKAEIELLAVNLSAIAQDTDNAIQASMD
jgi:hypothetical protein